MNKSIAYVAFLRGINVGGVNLVSMAALRQSFEQLGFSDVRTYLNSGNILFRSDSSDGRALEDTIETALAPYFTERVVVVVRSAEQMKATLAHIPKSWQDPSDKKCNVIFLRHTIDSPRLLENFTPKPAIEELHYAPGVLFWSARLDSLTKSTMLKLSSSPLYQDMTNRGLNTVRKICQMMQQIEPK